MSSSNERGEVSFEDQFEPHGAEFLYRTDMRGPPIPVNADERWAFIEANERAQRLLAIAFLVPAISVVEIALAWDVEDPLSKPAFLFGGVFAFLVVAVGRLRRWFWMAPARALQRRTPIGSGRSLAEVKRIKLSRLRWRDLALSLSGGALVLAIHSIGAHGIFRILTIIGCAGGLLAVAGQLFWKWRLKIPTQESELE